MNLTHFVLTEEGFAALDLENPNEYILFTEEDCSEICASIILGGWFKNCVPVDFGIHFEIPNELTVEVRHEYRTNHWTVIDKESFDKYSLSERKRIRACLKIKKQ